MTARVLIERAVGEEFRDVGGNAFRLRPDPGLPRTRIDRLEDRLGVPLPAEIRELLAFTSGFRFRPFGQLEFTPDGTFGLEELLPLGVTVATDGCGNEWVVDIACGTGAWGPVVFVCHDPPVAAIEAPGLEEFIEQVLETGRPGHESQVAFVTTTAVERIWKEDPFLLDLEASRTSSDPALAEFSRRLPNRFRVADLRRLEIGAGFAWGRNGPGTPIRRLGSQLVFGVEGRMSLLGRLRDRVFGAL